VVWLFYVVAVVSGSFNHAGVTAVLAFSIGAFSHFVDGVNEGKHSEPVAAVRLGNGV
jgi:hypothetical protein